MVNQDYINSLSPDDLKMELIFYMEQVQGFSQSLRKLDEIPNHHVLYMLGGPAMNMRLGLWESGKLLQQKHGLEKIPPKTEYECAAGLWEILRKAILSEENKKLDQNQK